MRRIRPAMVAVVVLATGAFGLFVDIGKPDAVAPDVGTSATSSPRGWNSGVYPGDGIDRAAGAAFAHYRGRQLDNVHVFLEAHSWRTIGFESWEIDQYARFPREIVLDVPLLPLKGGGNLHDVAEGRDDQYFRSLARELVTLRRRRAILVLGSEFNGNWESYSAFHPRTFVAAFRHVAHVLKRVSPRFRIDWTGNVIDNQAGQDPFLSDYPGNEVVDIVGVDAYDHGDSRIAGHGFKQWLDRPFGLAAWMRFARRHDKPFSVPEWGLTASSGDQPTYVRGMFRFFRANADVLAFEDYFNEPRHGTRNSLSQPDEMPKSSRVYRALWSRLPPAPRFGTSGLRRRR